MGSTFYVSADREHAGPWTFTGEQVKDCVRRHWPASTVSSAFENFLEIDAEVEPGQRAELSFNLRHGAFSFEDREPHSAPLTVIYTVLRELAPQTPVVWWIDYDADLQPLDLAGGRGAFIDSFPA
ncbi:hypothetical protein P3T27_006583 [Kitasatospora sp. MAA19]|uniref:hypothetical protein n=1 Tax=unclassified Kitasatospora TaxID=2633591 RepID=UPI0024737501|nr:hypothetical protein [Kitasatospora sp. MAA19]MDH6709834.1 hypothetical protein [Kitasatospora sp. MAA19]